jgi:hypothetical protein
MYLQAESKSLLSSLNTSSYLFITLKQRKLYNTPCTCKETKLQTTRKKINRGQLLREFWVHEAGGVQQMDEFPN